MSRKTERVVVTDEGRDKGKAFHLTEMPALRAEKWATRFFFALGGAGVDFPENVKGLGLAGVAIVGLQAIESVKFADAEPLLDDLMTCVMIEPTPGRLDILRPPTEDDIEEWKTYLLLRSEVVALHLGFSVADVLSKLYRQEIEVPPAADKPNTQTSPGS